MPRDMLCYCLNLTYDDMRRLWADGYFDRRAAHQAGNYCTSCRGDLACLLAELGRRPGEESGSTAGGDSAPLLSVAVAPDSFVHRSGSD